MFVCELTVLIAVDAATRTGVRHMRGEVDARLKYTLVSNPQ